MGGNKTNNRSDRQQIGHMILSDKSYSTILWNACDYVLHFNFETAHIPGSVNTQANFLSRLELKVMEKIREVVQTTSVEVKTSSSDGIDEEQFFFTQADGEDEIEEETLLRKEHSWKKATERVAHEVPSSLKPSIKEITEIHRKTTSYSMQGIQANARIRVEQDVNLVLKNLNFKIFGQPYDEVLLTTYKRFKHYKVNEDRIIFKYGLLFRKHYGKTGNSKNYQILIPKQLVDEVLRRLHGEFSKHPELLKR